MLKNRSSTIGLEYPNKTIRSIRVYDWNGNTMHDGQILLNCWDDFRHMIVLTGLGDLQALGPSVESTVALCRDRHVSWSTVATRTFQSRQEWRTQMRRLGCSCFYLFDSNTSKWNVWDSSGVVSDIDSYKL